MGTTGALSSLGSGGVALANPFEVMWSIIANGGWAIFVFLILAGGAVLFVRNRREAFRSKVKWILLAIDIPKDNEQTPKAVEHIFNHLFAIKKTGDFYMRYWQGYTQQPLSFEIVSLGGYVQFLVRLPENLRDLVEAAFYAQYPDAEITEVEDYTEDIPNRFPHREWDIWGTELKLENKDYYPITTYPAFEHTLTQQFLDPMASFLEILSRLRRGEQIWIQIIIAPPADDKWRKNGLREIKKLIGESSGGEGTLLKASGRVLAGTYETLVASLYAPGRETEPDESGPPNLIQYLPPNDKRVVESIGMKISKLGYETKIRVVYAAKKKCFQDDRPAAVIGALRQFNSLDLNGFTIDKRTKTSAKFFRSEQRKLKRKNQIIRAYKRRDTKVGPAPFVLNSEELATIFHFPVITVKAPLLKKTEAKKSEPPTRLPIIEESPNEEVAESEVVLPPTREQQEEAAATDSASEDEPRRAGPPENLPFSQ